MRRLDPRKRNFGINKPRLPSIVRAPDEIGDSSTTPAHERAQGLPIGNQLGVHPIELVGADSSGKRWRGQRGF